MHGLDTIVAMNNARQASHDQKVEVEALQARLERLQLASIALIEKIGELQEKVDSYEKAESERGCCGKCQGGDQ